MKRKILICSPLSKYIIWKRRANEYPLIQHQTSVSVLTLMSPGGEVKSWLCGRREPSSLAPVLSALDRGRPIVPGFGCRGLGRSKASIWHSPQAPEGKEGRCRKDEPRELALPLAAVHWARPGQQLQLSLPTVALLIPEERKPWGHLAKPPQEECCPFSAALGPRVMESTAQKLAVPLEAWAASPMVTWPQTLCSL